MVFRVWLIMGVPFFIIKFVTSYKFTYSSVPNRRACMIINFGGKSPTYMTLFGPTRLLILRNFSNLHVYSILQAYWFWRFFSHIHFYSTLHIYWFLIKYLILQYTGTLNWEKKHSTGQGYICKEVTSFKIHTLHVYYTLQVY